MNTWQPDLERSPMDLASLEYGELVESTSRHNDKLEQL